jgi:hypothetical protein
MSVARVTEISSTSDKGFEDAIQKGIARATQTLHGIYDLQKFLAWAFSFLLVRERRPRNPC